MLHDPARHERLGPARWDAALAEDAIRRIVSDAEARYSEDRYWPIHPADRPPDSPPDHVETSLYDGACGVLWALERLQSAGVVTLSRDYTSARARLLEQNRKWRPKSAEADVASYLLGETSIRMMEYAATPSAECADALHALIAGNADHPSRELMLGAPGTLLSAWFLYEHTREERWGELFRRTASTLHSQLEWSVERQCHYFTQQLFGVRTTYLGAVHGFVGVAAALLRGRTLLDDPEWTAWERRIVDVVRRTAKTAEDSVAWAAEIHERNEKKLLQLCHGAPGFVVCLAAMPTTELDDSLIGAGRAIASAGPLCKGSNLCHGTGGNGYALLKLFQRTRDSAWLDLARAFAMHGIAQTEEARARDGHGRYSLWTGDLGFAIHLLDCQRADAQFPTLDAFF